MARWEDRASSGFDYGDKDWKHVVSSRAFYEGALGKALTPASERPIDVAKAMLGAVNMLWQNHIGIIKSFFDDQEFRVFCQLHSVFKTGVVSGKYHDAEAFEKAVGTWLMPRPGDIELVNPVISKDMEKVLEILGKNDFEIMPKCIFIPGAVVTFDVNNKNEWGGPGDVAIASGLELYWPVDDNTDVIDVTQYLKEQPTVVV